MLQSITNFIFEHANNAHWIIFSALLLAGLNLPISEDVLIIISAILASTIIPEKTMKIFLFVFMGCFLSDWIMYWIGRLLGPKLWHLKWFNKIFPKKRLDQSKNFYDKYGFFTLFIGRFIPFGVRNALLFTAGLGKMSFKKFLLSDGIACACSNSVLFSLTYILGRNLETLLPIIKKFHFIIFGLFGLTLIILFWYHKKRKNIKNVS